MIKLRLDIFITLVLCLKQVTAEARYYTPKSILRGGNPEVIDILLRSNGNPEISTVLSDNPKPILRIGNPAAATHRDNPKPVAGGYPKAVIPVGNPAVAAILRDNLRAILRGGNPEISAMLRDNTKPFLLAAIPEIPTTMPRDKLKHNILTGIPELFAMPHGNQKPNLHGGGSLKPLAMLREYIKPILNNPTGLRIRNDSESDNLFLTSGMNKYTIKDNDLKETFNKMVETVTKVNDERILSLKKFFELENYLPQVLRTTKQKNPLIAIIMNTPNYNSKYDDLNINHVLTQDTQYVIVKKMHKQPSMPDILKEIIDGTHFNHNEDDDEINISQESDETRFTNNLRGWKSCKKNASKACQKACKKAFKNLYDDYQCSKSMKKDAKKECKRRCEGEFKNSAESSDSDE